MSAETVSSINAVEVYVPLVTVVTAGTEVLRPTTGLLLGPDVVQVLATTDYDPTAEEWQFPPGTKVKCAIETHGSRELLVARHRME